MKTITLLATSAVFAIALTNCAESSAPNTQRGAVAGGLIGAATGAVVGKQSGRTTEGALLGGAVGAAAGGLYGNSQDNQQRQRNYGGY